MLKLLGLLLFLVMSCQTLPPRSGSIGIVNCGRLIDDFVHQTNMGSMEYFRAEGRSVFFFSETIKNPPMGSVYTLLCIEDRPHQYRCTKTGHIIEGYCLNEHEQLVSYTMGAY